jgi:N-acetylmuramoyl-L-alanine amidase
MPVVTLSRLAALVALLALRPADATPRPTWTSRANDVAAVDAVTFTTQGSGLLVRVHATARVRSFSVDQRGRTVRLVLFGARLAPTMSRGPVASPVRDYRVEAGDDQVAVTFDAPDSPAPQAYPDPDSNDLLLSFGGSPPRRVVAWGGVAVPEAPRPDVVAAPTRRTAPARRAATRPVSGAGPGSPGAPAARPGAWPSAPAPRPAAVPPYAPGAAPGQSSSTYTGSGANWRLDTIVLDAGHGGHDIGATYNGVREKDVTLGIVRHLGRMIESELGVRVVYTRSDDHFETLRDRGRIANRAGGKLFVSVHANAAAASSARGTETYFLAPHRSSSAHDVMERENAVIQLETAPELYAEFTDEGNILQAMAMSAYQEESQALARLIEGQFVGQRRPSRGVKQAGFLVLWAASMPAVLVETGFVSNADEARLLGSRAGQEQTARAIFDALSAYKARYERGLRLASAG